MRSRTNDMKHQLHAPAPRRDVETEDHALHTLKQNATPTRNRIAVVGYGYWGSKHVRVLSSAPGVDVTIVDGETSRLAEAVAHYPSARVAAQLDDVLDD